MVKIGGESITKVQKYKRALSPRLLRLCLLHLQARVQPDCNHYCYLVSISDLYCSERMHPYGLVIDSVKGILVNVYKRKLRNLASDRDTGGA